MKTPRPAAEGDLPVLQGATPLEAFGRHLVWLLALFVVLVALVHVRLQVQVLRQRLDKTGRLLQQAEILNSRLELEVDSRRRAVAMERAAEDLDLTDPTRVVVVPRTR